MGLPVQEAEFEQCLVGTGHGTLLNKEARLQDLTELTQRNKEIFHDLIWIWIACTVNALEISRKEEMCRQPVIVRSRAAILASLDHDMTEMCPVPLSESSFFEIRRLCRCGYFGNGGVRAHLADATRGSSQLA